MVDYTINLKNILQFNKKYVSIYILRNIKIDQLSNVNTKLKINFTLTLSHSK